MTARHLHLRGNYKARGKAQNPLFPLCEHLPSYTKDFNKWKEGIHQRFLKLWSGTPVILGALLAGTLWPNHSMSYICWSKTQGLILLLRTEKSIQVLIPFFLVHEVFPHD